MMQALQSCPAFNKIIIDRKEYCETHDKRLCLEYIKMLESAGIAVSNTVLDDDFKIGHYNGSRILNELVKARRGKKDRLLHGRQEDFHEGLTFLIDQIGGRITNLFSIRYKMSIQCRNPDCKEPIRAGPQEEPNYMIQLFEEDPVLQDSLNSKESIQNYILRHINIPDDYKCESCGIQNTQDPVTKKVTHNVMQVYSLARLSEIIVLVFNKYHTKKVKFFPQSLDFKGTNGDLHYEVMAQIEHGGNMSGGHYWVKCRRPKPPGFVDHLNTSTKEAIRKRMDPLQKRKEAWQNRLTTEMKKPANERNERMVNKCEERISNVEKQLKQYKAQLRDIDKQKDDDDDHIVFQMNDSSVYIDTNRFVPTANTYMVFYHLM